jgi:hypothetical protein
MALCRELALCGLPFERQKAFPISYKGALLDCGYRLDLVVGGEIIVELKAVEELLPIHEASCSPISGYPGSVSAFCSFQRPPSQERHPPFRQLLTSVSSVLSVVKNSS